MGEGPKHSTFDIARVTADNFDTFAAHPVCGHNVVHCMDTYAMYSYYVRASNGDCVLTLNCHNAGYSGLESTEVAKWNVRIDIDFIFAYTLTEGWWGAPDTTFSLQRMTADNYEAFLNHPICGGIVQLCAESTYYVQASNGDCVMPLLCSDEGYSNLRASHMTTDWQVSVYSDSQSHTFSQPWKGLEDSSFAIKQVIDSNFQKFSQHPYCGYGVQRCYDEGYGYAFYVASDDGDCVMTLNCNNPGYSNLHASELQIGLSALHLPWATLNVFGKVQWRRRFVLPKSQMRCTTPSSPTSIAAMQSENVLTTRIVSRIS